MKTEMPRRARPARSHSLTLNLAGIVALIFSPTLPLGAKPAKVEPTLRKLEDLQLAAVQFQSSLALPRWEKTPQQVRFSVDKIIGDATKRLDALAALKASDATFANTFQEMDQLDFDVNLVASRVNWIKQTALDPKMRGMAAECVKKLEDWNVSVHYREDVFRVLQAFADTKPAGDEEDQRLILFTLRDYKRAGLGLPAEQREKVQQLRKELARVGNDFSTNIATATAPVKFTRAELAGVPDALLETPGVKTGPDEYTIDASVFFQFIGVMENASYEFVRKRVSLVRDNRARDLNIPLLQKMVELRAEIARTLGYKSWDDFQTEPRMARTGAAALQLLQNLKTGLQPKFDEEMAEFKAIKAADPNSETAEVNLWDWRFCAEQLKKQKFLVDTSSLRNFFPYEKVLTGIFAAYQRIFGVKIEPVQPESTWSEGVELYFVSDAKSNAPLGLFYLDMFPRAGKFNDFAQFGLIKAKRLPNGIYQRPTVALCGNFPPPRKDIPSLLSHDEVEALFREFGHVLHTVLTQAKYSRFSGDSVPGDFVTAPSQMLENCAWDKTVLDGFAADYKNPKKKLPADLLKKMKAAKLAIAATTYRRQLSLGITDLVLHGPQKPGEKLDVVAISNQIFGEAFLPVDPSTAMVASFDYLNGDDSGYYAYIWADSMAADLTSVFAKAKGGLLDATTGMKMRNEIFAQGNARDVGVSVEKFLGRAQSIQPFLESVAIKK